MCWVCLLFPPKSFIAMASFGACVAIEFDLTYLPNIFIEDGENDLVAERVAYWVGCDNAHVNREDGTVSCFMCSSEFDDLATTAYAEDEKDIDLMQATAFLKAHNVPYTTTLRTYAVGTDHDMSLGWEAYKQLHNAMY